MKILIIDDEEAMHLILKKMLVKIAGIEIVGMFQDTDGAWTFIEKKHVDIVLLDIHLPKVNGIEFAKKLLDKNIAIIFITAYKDYALDAFDVLAIDYIVKPIMFERLQKSIMRAIAIRQYEFAEERFEGDNQISIYCFGGLEVRTKQGTVKWLSRKSAEIFSYLLLQRGRMISRESIIENIFPNMPQKNAETYLNTAIYQMRKSLSMVGIKSIVLSNKDAYRLDLTNIYVDFIDFEERIRKFQQLNRDNMEEVMKIEEIYKGALLGERAYLWSLHESERYFRLYHSFVKKISEELLKMREYPTASHLLKKLLIYNELDEEIVALLLRAKAGMNDRQAVQEIFKQYTKVLKKELKMAPSNEIISLYHKLLTQRQSAKRFKKKKKKESPNDMSHLTFSYFLNTFFIFLSLALFILKIIEKEIYFYF